MQQPSYALPPETSEAILVSDAYNWGWTRAWRNAGGIILGALLYVIALAIVLLVFASIFGFFASSTLDPYGYGNDSGPAPFLVLLFAAIASLLGVVVQAGIIRGALEISHGRPVTIATFWTFKDFGRVFLAILLVGGLTAVGTLLFVIPGVLFAFFAQFTLYFVIDKGVRPWDALVASVQLVNRRIGTIVTLYLGTEFASLLGVLVCYVGIIVTWPVSILATTWVYRRMLGERVSG